MDNIFNDKIKPLGATYNLVVGGRNTHKTTDFNIFAVNDFIENGNQFFLLRRKTSSLVNENWFTPFAKKYIKEQYNKRVVYSTRLLDNDNKNNVKYFGYFYLQDLETEKLDLIGGNCFLSCEQNYKSNENDLLVDADKLVFEEFIANTQFAYLENEIDKLLSLISTFFRNRNCTVYLIGNTLKGQENNPYFSYFSIDDIELKKNKAYAFRPAPNLAKIGIFYTDNVKNDNIPEHQKVKGNAVGLNEGWKTTDGVVENFDNFESAEFSDFVLKFRGRLYYVYFCRLTKNSDTFVYISKKRKTVRYYPLRDFIEKNVNPKHYNYSKEVLYFLYPELKSLKFSDIKKINLDNSRLIDFELDNTIDKVKNNYFSNLSAFQEAIYNYPLTADDKAILFFIKNLMMMFER